MTRHLADMTSPEVAALLAASEVFALVPVGSTEPHGPHLPLLTDVIISNAACERAAERLQALGQVAVIAPAVPYGVTECAAGFAGAVSVPAAALTTYLRAVAEGLLAAGFARVCLVNNHLEPAHDQAVRAAATSPRICVACPLDRKWARTLAAEFKRGECHAGAYETSIVMASAPDLVRDALRTQLPEVPISLSRGLAAGQTTFVQMGMASAYAGAPAAASPAEGHAQLELLADMVIGELLAPVAGSV